MIDTGIYADHQSLREYDPGNFSAKIVGWYDACFPTNLTPYDISTTGHGTHVASIAAGHNLFNGTAPGANIAAINIYTSTPQGALDANDASVEGAINWTIANRTTLRIRVVTMSFGRQPPFESDDPLNQMVSRLIDAGIIAIASAGNWGDKGISPPGASPYAITVGAVDDNNVIYSASGQGPTVQGYAKPDVVAPGVNIEAAGISNETALATHTGTSMAVPHVAGAAAILLQANATLTPLQVKMFLCATAYKTRESGSICDQVEGYGKIQIQSALEALNLAWNPIDLPQVTSRLSMDGESVWARQVHLEPGRIYTFRATGASGGRASVSVFEMQPDDYGRPQLIKTNVGSYLDRIALEVQEAQDALITVKLLPSSQDDIFFIEQLDDSLYIGLISFAIGSSAWGIVSVVWVIRSRPRKSKRD